MFREFNVKFEDVEMLGGADNLLEGTEVTKVIVRGDSKMSSLDSMLKNCNELDTIDGELDLNGVSDIDNLLEGTELVKSINLKNINNENISANNSFPHVDRINIGGELYNKKAMQNVIASKEWTFDNITYSGTVGDNIVSKEVNIIDDNKVTIQDTLEQKATGIEIIGQTYENLVEGKGEYKLTDTFSTTWTESNNSIENPPSMIEIPEIWGNTVQDENDLNIIQSVGDLYCDEEGTPILDEEGNEQYKLEIISSGKNICPVNTIEPETWSGSFSNHKVCNLNLKSNTTYTISCKEATGSLRIRVYNGETALVEFWGGYNGSPKVGTFTTGNVTNTWLMCYDFGLVDVVEEIMIEEGSVKTEYEPYTSNKTTILMPQQLKGLDNVKDKLFYDYKKSMYVIENKIGDFDNINDLSEAILPVSQIIETKILEKPSLETYSPKTYISTNAEIQPSQMTVTNKKVDFIPLGLQANKDYTLQLDSVGKDDKPITVNLGGTETTVQPVNDTSKHHKVVVRTPNTLTTDKLDLSGEGVMVNDVMLFEGGSNEIKQEVEYVEGIQSIGELQDDGTYLIGIKTNEGFNVSIQTNNALAKGDKLYWNKSNKRYEIDRGGSIEVPTVSGDVIDLPRLYQREDTHFSTSTGNIKPSKVKLDYNDLD